MLATWWRQATAGVNYVRAELPARHLPGQVLNLETYDIQASPGMLDVDPLAYAFPRQQGPAVWLFSGTTTRAILMKAMQLKGVPVFFECDDNYTVSPDVPETSSWQTFRSAVADAASFETACDIAAFCDGVIVSTPTLADVYAQLNDTVHVCRNCVDPDDWAPLDKPDDGILRVGWAASDSHLKDAPLLKDALRWLSGRPDVEVIIIGIQAPFDVPVVRIPWVESLADYRALLQTIDVMLCPLRRSEWADCKSDLKALEAAMAGAMSVVSASPAYDLWQERTIVCADERDWRKAAKHLYRHRDEVQALAAEHRAYVLSERTIQTGVEQWRTALSLSKTTPAASSRSAAVGAAT